MSKNKPCMNTMCYLSDIEGKYNCCNDWTPVCNVYLSEKIDIIRMKEKLNELEALFKLQRTRTKEADLLWQKETGNPGIYPDLGKLLEWLMERKETAWDMFNRLFEKYNMRVIEKIPKKYRSIYTKPLTLIRFITICPEKEAIKIMVKIEKELSSE